MASVGHDGREKSQHSTLIERLHDMRRNAHQASILDNITQQFGVELSFMVSVGHDCRVTNSKSQKCSRHKRVGSTATNGHLNGTLSCNRAFIGRSNSQLKKRRATILRASILHVECAKPIN